jgi:hypothetical protein
MSDGITHATVGVFLSAAVAVLYGIFVNPASAGYVLPAAIIGLFGALFPDMDHPMGMLRQTTTMLFCGLAFIVFFVTYIYLSGGLFGLTLDANALESIKLLLVMMLSLSLFFFALHFTSHRGFLHSIGCMVIVGGIFFWMPFIFLVSWCIGYISHLVLDEEVGF